MTDTFKLSSAIGLHDELNPALFDEESRMLPDRRLQLLRVAMDFIQHIGIDHLDVEDIRLVGSQAAYTYTPHSDLDVHLIVNMDNIKDEEVYTQFFDATKWRFNETHDVTIAGYDVEMYIEPNTQAAKSSGMYSLVEDRWVSKPVKDPEIEKDAAKYKYRKVLALCKKALATDDQALMNYLIGLLGRYRRVGLNRFGEFSAENLVWKVLRSSGMVDKLFDHSKRLHDKSLSRD